jgi:serine/threonine-protein kinase
VDSTAPLTQWREAMQRFEELLELDEPQRAAALEALRQAQPPLHGLVLRLLEADRAATSGDYLAEGALAAAARHTWTEPRLQAGTGIGPYRLEHPLGRGGMGEVWLAQRRDGLTDAPVALKLLHAHLAQSALRARFLREGRILGQLSHPNIARLLDAGISADGQPYLALEYVEGERIDQWCDHRRLDLPARLRLFLQACESVAHAHAHLVVHRDLKPSNILVSADGAIKLLDFGIAKLLDAEQAQAGDASGGGEATELTRLGGRALTPEYAAPEQVTGAAVTTSTDVYALGVLLYGLLSGRRPYGAPGQGVAQAEREVLESEPPPPSQARLPRGGSAVGAEELAALRGTTPRGLRAALRGDLDTITLKALKKAPRQRYPSVPALAEDLRRHLGHLPVLAQPDSAAYLIGKFVRRNRVGTAAVAAVSLAVAAGVAGVVWQARLAQAESRRAERVKEYLIDVFESADPAHSQGETITARALLDQGEKQLTAQLGSEPATAADLSEALARIHASLGNYERAQQLAQSACDLRGKLFGAGDPRTARALHTLGAVLQQRSRFEESRTALEQAAAIIAAREGPDSLELARIRQDLGTTLASLGQREQAIALQRSAWQAFQRQLGPRDPEALDQLFSLGQRQEEAEDYAAAEHSYRDTIAGLSAALGPEHSRVAQVRQELAGLLDRLGRADEADQELTASIAILRKVYGDHHPTLGNALFSRAILLISKRRLAEADAALRETLGIYPAGSYQNAQSRRYLGVSLTLQERYAEAETELKAAVAGLHQAGGADDVQQYRAEADLATAILRQGHAAEAEPIVRDAVANLERRIGPESYEVRNPLKRLGETLLEEGRYAEALATLQRTRALELKLLKSPEHRDLAYTDYLLGRTLLAQDSPAAARPYVEHNVALCRKNFPGAELGRALVLLGRLDAAAGNRAAAHADYTEAVAEYRRAKGEDDPHTREAQALLLGSGG